MVMKDLIFFENKLFLTLKDKTKDSFTFISKQNSLSLLLSSFTLLLLSIMNIILFRTEVENSIINIVKKDITDSINFILYFTTSFTGLLFTIAFIARITKIDSSVFFNIISSLQQFLLCYSSLLLFYFILQKSDFSLNLIYSKFFFDLILKFTYLLLIDSYYINFFFANFTYIFISFITEFYLNLNEGYINLIFEAVDFIVITFILYLINYIQYSKSAISNQMRNFLSKPIGEIRINPDEESYELSKALKTYLSNIGMTAYLNNHLSDIDFNPNQINVNLGVNLLDSSRGNTHNHNRQGNHAESALSIVNKESNKEGGMNSFDYRFIKHILQNLKTTEVFNLDFDLLLIDIIKEHEKYKKFEKTNSFFKEITKFIYQNVEKEQRTLLGSVNIDLNQITNTISKTASCNTDKSNIANNNSPINNKNENLLNLLLFVKSDNSSNELIISVCENPSYQIQLNREQDKLTDNLRQLSLLSHEFKSPILSIKAIVDLIEDEIAAYQAEIFERINFIENGNFICNSDFNRYYSHKQISQSENSNSLNQTKLISSESIGKILKRKYAFISKDIKKVKDLSEFVILLFKDVEFLTKVNSTYDFNPANTQLFKSGLIQVRDVFDFCFSILETRNITSSAKKIKLTKFYDKKLPKELLTDETKLKQIIVNLLSNSVKFTEHGEISLRFENIVDKENKRYLKVIIMDTGKGISKEKIHSIMNSNCIFNENIKDESKSNTTGSGFGLFIVRNIISKIGKDFDIYSKENEGTTVSFKIPISTFTEAEAEDEEEENKSFHSSDEEKEAFNELHNQSPHHGRNPSINPKNRDSIIEVNDSSHDSNQEIEEENKNLNDNHESHDISKQNGSNYISINNNNSHLTNTNEVRHITVSSKISSESIKTKKISYYNVSDVYKHDTSSNQSPIILPKKRYSMNSLESNKPSLDNEETEILDKFYDINDKEKSKPLIKGILKPRKARSSNVIAKPYLFSKLTKVVEEESESDAILNNVNESLEKVTTNQRKDNKLNSHKTDKKFSLIFSNKLINKLNKCTTDLSEEEKVIGATKILIVDDQKPFLDGYKKCFLDYKQLKNKICIDVADNGKNALSCIFRNTKTPYSAIIIDQNMDDLKGNEIAFIVRSSKEYKNTKIFLATGETDSCYLVNVNKVKVIDYILEKTNLKSDVKNVLSILGLIK